MMAHSHILRKLTTLALALLLCLSTMLPALAEDSMNAELQSAMDQEATRMIKMFTYNDLYENTDWTNTFTAFPEKYDLRDTGVVPEIRNQKNWGTCWGFATIAACETSLLSEFGMTTQEFLDKYGLDLNLSEKHLAWFGTGRMPALSDYPEGEYVYPELESQAGEGLYRTDEETDGPSVRYMNGGMMTYSSSIFASGQGPVFEYMVPYKAADGTDSTAADWSLDESMRFGMAFELENSALLPSPAQRRADGSYMYNKAGTDAIKSEILAGRGVTIAYHADQAMDPEAVLNMYRDQLATLGLEATLEQVQALLDIGNGDLDLHTVSDDLFVFYVKFLMLQANADISALTDEALLSQREALLASIDEAAAQAESETAASKEETAAQAEAASPATEEEAAAQQAAIEEASRKMAEEMGVDYEEYMQVLESSAIADEAVYITTDTYAQHTDNKDATVTHAVTIIGWDDTFAASNFLEGHQPPADGAWIVRNSWGPNYGIGGYFYLSYYDQTITMPETFDFVVINPNDDVSQVDVMGYDYMQADSINSVQMKEFTSLANVFDIAENNVLSYVSVLTAAKSTSVTVQVYLLDEDATSPVDGTLLDVVTDTFLYGGYHRIPLNYNYAIPEGSKISVVQVQRVANGSDTAYAVPYCMATNRKYMEAQNVFELRKDEKLKSWFVGNIGKGESYVCLDGAWTDWSDVVTALQENSNSASYYSYDNLNIKLYAYPLSELETLHTLSEPIVFNGAYAQVCSDCGYTIVEQAITAAR